MNKKRGSAFLVHCFQLLKAYKTKKEKRLQATGVIKHDL